MKRKKRSVVPLCTSTSGYHQVDKPIDCYNELADPNAPPVPPMRYAVPRIDPATFAMLEATQPEVAAEYLRLNHPSAVGR